GPPDVLLADGCRSTISILPAAPAEDPQAPRRIALPPLPRLSGRVLDATTGRPLAGALVWPGDDPGGATFTDERGAYTVASRQSARAWVQAEASGFRPRAVRLPRSGRPPAVPTVALEPANLLEGRVVDGAGKALAGVAITAAPDDPPSYEVFQRDRAAGRSRSDAEGRFLLRGLPAAPAYEIAAAHPGYRAVRERVPARREVRLVLTETRAAFGLTTDSEDRPLAGVEITVRPARSAGIPAAALPAGDAEAVTVTSDERGRFEIPALPAERVDLEAGRAGFSPLIVPGLAVGAGPAAADLGVLSLVAGAAITGRVVDAAGRPLDEARVWWTETDRRPGPGLAAGLRQREPAAVSGADGAFSLADLASGRRMTLLFAREGFLPAWIAGARAPNEQPLVVVLEPAATLRGRVETVDGEPVPGARVALRPAPPPPGTVGVEMRRSENTADARAGADGTFSFAEVAPGGVLLEAQAEGFLPAEAVAVEVPAAEEIADVRLVLDPGAQVRGRVVTRGGEPVAGASLRIGPAGALTDAEGRYRMAGVALGVKALVLTHPAYRRLLREVDVRPGVNEVDLTAEEGLAVSGRVRDETGAPSPGAVVTLRNRGERGPRALAATADGDGRFRVLAVVDGRYDLEAEAPGFAPVLHPEVVAVDGNDVAGLQVVLRRGATLTGRVRGVDLEHLAALEVTAERAGRPARPGALDYRGHYRIPHLEPGDWHLRARLDGGRREAAAWVTIAPGDDEVERDLELAAGLVLDGRVVFEGGALPRAQVSLRGLDLVADRNVASDHRGAFRLENLEPGRYRLEVVHGELMLSQSQDVELAADRTVVVEITTAVLSGTVVAAATGEGVPDALVSLQRLLGAGEPGPLTTVGTDVAGSFVTATLAPGRYRLTVRADRYAPEERLVEVAPGPAPEPLRVELQPTEGLALTILRAAGHPPSRAAVLVLAADGRPVHFEDMPLSDFGHGYLRQAPPGTWTLLVKAPGSAALLARATVPGDRLEVTLPPAAPLAVRVPALSDSPVAASVSLAGADGTPFLGVEPTGGLQQSWPLIGGLATVPDLPAGTWRAQVTAADGRTWEGAVATGGVEAAAVVLE
ncbi:MAG TPA: carboxypeptidase-like regulatory domain-containing protein, partial [Thermoanaerobaculia bacterium]|nr:carboxypeptidase-like regulatory domain-containing protein [Thermoanaerobaculia bacterium]